ncbi:MAG: flippase-like domain-containing protein [Solirubrobacterales bacterium]|nr:flippase-like domain-containing protein [Solirubrobacterales bacterium]
MSDGAPARGSRIAAPEGATHERGADGSSPPETDPTETDPTEAKPTEAKPTEAHAEEMPRVVLTRRRAISFAIFVLSAIAFLYYGLPKVTGLGTTIHRIQRGDPWWIALGVVFELLSFAGYVAVFRAVFARGSARIGLRESYLITLAGVLATRLFAAAGAGGIAITAWALRRSGMEARVVATRMVAFLVLLYSVYAGSLVLNGVGLGVGLFPGGGSFAITIVPAIIGAFLIGVAVVAAMLPADIEPRLAGSSSGRGRPRPWQRAVARLGTVPAMARSGTRQAIEIVRTRDPALLGAVAWWGFDMGVLWACFHAFGVAPPFTVIWMAYFVGMFGNLLPLPGGLGGVEGGMIGALAAFGVDINLAVLAVLSYRAISFWLPTIPGAIAYLQLRRTVSHWRAEDLGVAGPARGARVGVDAVRA